MVLISACTEPTGSKLWLRSMTVDGSDLPNNDHRKRFMRKAMFATCDQWPAIVLLVDENLL